MPIHLSRETTILNVIIRIFQLQKKYVIHGALNTSTVLKGCNEVPNVGRTEELELVHHLVKFFTLKNFHRSFTILIEQMMCQECFIGIQGNFKDFGVKDTKNLTFYQNQLIGRQTSSSKESLRSIKVDEGKCEDETNASYFTTKASKATFTTNAIVLG